MLGLRKTIESATDKGKHLAIVQSVPGAPSSIAWEKGKSAATDAREIKKRKT